MTKFDEAIALYESFMKEKLGDAAPNTTVLTALAKMLGPAIYDKDASLVACSDKAELGRVKELFLIGELGLADTPELDTAIAVVCKKMGTSNRKKFRVVFYYLLLEYYGQLVRFDSSITSTTEPPVPAAVAPKIVKESTPKIKKEIPHHSFGSFDETFDFYQSFLTNDLKFFDIQSDLLSNLIQTTSETSIVDIDDITEITQIKEYFVKGRLGVDDSDSIEAAIKLVDSRMGDYPKYRPVFYYLLTKHLGREWVITQPVEATLF